MTKTLCFLHGILLGGILQAENLTIATSTETGTFGTNWSIVGIKPTADMNLLVKRTALDTGASLKVAGGFSADVNSNAVNVQYIRATDSISLSTDNELLAVRAINADGAFQHVLQSTSFSIAVNFSFVNFTLNSNGLTLGIPVSGMKASDLKPETDRIYPFVPNTLNLPNNMARGICSP
jgi:hypothetical protein